MTKTFARWCLALSLVLVPVLALAQSSDIQAAAKEATQSPEAVAKALTFVEMLRGFATIVLLIGVVAAAILYAYQQKGYAAWVFVGAVVLFGGFWVAAMVEQPFGGDAQPAQLSEIQAIAHLPHQASAALAIQECLMRGLNLLLNVLFAIFVVLGYILALGAAVVGEFAESIRQWFFGLIFSFGCNLFAPFFFVIPVAPSETPQIADIPPLESSLTPIALLPYNYRGFNNGGDYGNFGDLMGGNGSTVYQQPGANGVGTNQNVRGFVPTDVNALRAALPPQSQYLAQAFIDAGQRYNLDPVFLAGISGFETGGWTSSAFYNKNNAMGISDAYGPTYQSSAQDSIYKMAAILGNPNGAYANQNTIGQIGSVYAPPGAENDPYNTNSEWASGVSRWMGTLGGKIGRGNVGGSVAPPVGSGS